MTTTMTASILESTIAALLAPGKGILAADESFPTIGKRFAALHHRARCNSLAVEGKYSAASETASTSSPIDQPRPL